MKNKMTLDEIYSTVADICNSLYNLNKEEKISQPDYVYLKSIAEKFYSAIGSTILYPEIDKN